MKKFKSNFILTKKRPTQNEMCFIQSQKQNVNKKYYLTDCYHDAMSSTWGQAKMFDTIDTKIKFHNSVGSYYKTKNEH